MASNAAAPAPAPRRAPRHDDRDERRDRPPASRSGSLWLAVHLPWLAGEVVHGDRPGPKAVSDETRRGWVVYRASGEARDRGVVPGMTLSAAGVVCPGLSARRRDPRREEKRLEAIAERLLRFSPLVSVQPPETVLLEVRGSLNLFGGLERLVALVGEELDAAGHRHRIAGAPAPAAAGCLARGGRERIVQDGSALRSALGDLPLGLLDLDERTLGRLWRAGPRTLRDLWRLPADGLARRFGTALVKELDRLQGRRPDPRPLHAPPMRFSAVLMLDWATDDLVRLEAGVGHLLDQWVAELRRSARGTTGFTIECLPEQGKKALKLDIGLRRISRDRDHLMRLAAERLGRVRLAGPVAGLVLSSDRLHPFPERGGDLFDGDGGEASDQWQRSEELLAMHLGGRGLDGLDTVAEHRPERAWRRSDPACRGAGTAASNGRRPLWLLDPPRPLPWSQSGPRQVSGDRERPRLVRGPERIETGWWDRRDQRRDYYAATDPRGRRLWVFWDLRREQWYLHGLFA